MSIRPLQELAAAAQQPLSSGSSNATPIAADSFLGFLPTAPDAAPSVRLRDVSTNAGFLLRAEHRVGMIALVGRQLRSQLIAQLISRLWVREYVLEDRCNFVQRRLNTGGVAPVVRLNRHGDDRTRIHIDRMLSLVSQVCATILHFGDLRVWIVKLLPVVILSFLLALAVLSRQILARRRLDVRSLGQTLQELVIARARIAAHDVAQRGVGLQRGRVDPYRLALDQSRTGPDSTRPIKSFHYARSNDGTDLRAGKLVLSKRTNWVDIIGPLVPPEVSGMLPVVISQAYRYEGLDGRVSARQTRYQFDAGGSPSRPDSPTTRSAT